MTDSLFKLVISSTTQQTAKTLSTLERHLALARYERVIILDDDAANCWCTFHMVKLRLQHRVNVMLIEVPMLFIWRDIHRDFALSRPVSTQLRLVATQFFCLVSRHQKKDGFFEHFHELLELIYWNASANFAGNHQHVLFKFASLMRDETGFNRMARILWKWTKAA